MEIANRVKSSEVNFLQVQTALAGWRRIGGYICKYSSFLHPSLTPNRVEHCGHRWSGVSEDRRSAGQRALASRDMRPPSPSRGVPALDEQQGSRSHLDLVADW